MDRLGDHAVYDALPDAHLRGKSHAIPVYQIRALNREETS